MARSSAGASAREGSAAESSPAASSSSFGEGVERLIALVSARSAGRAGDDDVERAVSALLGRGGEGADKGGTAPAAPATAVSVRAAARVPVPDEANYDDDKGGGTNADADPPRRPTRDTARRIAQGEERVAALRKRIASGSSDGAQCDDGGQPQQQQPPSKRARRRSKKVAAAEERDGLDESHWEFLDSIPLGRQGGKMMVTFGDGRMPDPKAVETALLGTRRCLQCAIRDARALRRRQQGTYARLREKAILHRRGVAKKPPAHKGEGCKDSASDGNAANRSLFDDDPRIQFRAMVAHDALGYNYPAGFDVSQLDALFPEEMRSYKRWKKMQEDYEEKAGKGDGKMKVAAADEDGKSSAAEGNDDDEDDGDNSDGQMGEPSGGHLNDRLAQFDLRTTKMKKSWYMTFSEVRQGSFLGRTVAGEKKLWERARKKTPGRNVGRMGTWEDLPAASVRFLHWIGFDPRSALPPPDEEAAQALAFLGYDFLGKIVERSILLRRLAERECLSGSAAVSPNCPSYAYEGGSDDLILEMRSEEQLDQEDILRALHDSTIMPEPLYRTEAGTGSESKPHLYFGPGFEERLEMELEEIVLGNKHDEELSDKEKKIRHDEDELFSSLQAPPLNLDGVLDVLGEGGKEGKMLKASQAGEDKNSTHGKGSGGMTSKTIKDNKGDLTRKVDADFKSTPAEIAPG